MRTILFAICALLQGCGSISTELYGPNGEKGYRIACQTSAYETCVAKAHEVCPRGYKEGGTFASIDVNDIARARMQNSARAGMIVQCL